MPRKKESLTYLKREEYVERFKTLSFPQCSKDCALITILGAGECENICPEKFRTGETTERGK